MQRFRTAVVCVLLMSAGSVCCEAQPPSTPPSTPPFDPHLRGVMTHVSWTSRDGAPTNITAIAQTTDGYLWLGTANGLYRFDGLKFVSYPTTALEAALPSADVSALAADGAGGLWIGFRIGGVSHLSLQGAVRNYRRPYSVQKIVVRKDGSVWCLGEHMILTLRGGEWEGFGREHGLPADLYLSLFFDREGGLWTSARGRLYRLPPGTNSFVLQPTRADIVVDVAQAPDGTIWLSDAWHSLRSVREGTAELKIMGYVRLLATGDSLWLAQDYRGLTHFPWPSRRSDPQVEKEPDLTSEQTNVIFGDRQQGIWVGTARGLDHFQKSNLLKLGGARIEYYPGLAGDASRDVFVGTLAHPVMEASGARLEPVGVKVGSSPMNLDDQGRLVLVDPFLNAMTVYTDHGLVRVPVPEEVHSSSAQAIGPDTDGTLLVSFDDYGMWRLAGGSWHRVPGDPAPLADPDVIYRDLERRTWFGSPSGMAVHDRAGYHSFSGEQAGGLGLVLTFFQTAGTPLWAGGANGAAIFDGQQFRPVRLAHGMLLRGVSGITADAAGNVWLNASAGIFRISREQVEKLRRQPNEAAEYSLVDTREGLEGFATQVKPTPSAVADQSGMLWFSTLGNVFALDPKLFFSPPAAVPLVIEQVLLNGRPVLDREHRPSELSTSSLHLAQLQIDYAGLDLVAGEKVRFQYMLEGEDSTWQDVGDRRQAFYQHLKPGSFHFRLRATATAGESPVWTELPQPLLLHLDPAFYQRLWFQIVLGCLLVSLLYLAYLARLRFLLSRVQAGMQVRHSERLRIARDLHDTLLQSVQGLMLRVHIAARHVPEDNAGRKALQIALERSDAVIDEARRRVKDLRDELPEGISLPERIAELAAELQTDQAIAVRVTEEGKPIALRPETEQECFRIAREALQNSLRHGNGTLFFLRLAYEPSCLQMTCSDDGDGFPSQVLAKGHQPGHWGLISMQERAAGMGAKITFRNNPEGGTCIDLMIPGRAAYRRSQAFPWARPQSWWLALHKLRSSASDRT